MPEAQGHPGVVGSVGWQVDRSLVEARRMLDEQRSTLDALRSRAAGLWGAATVAVGFLAAAVVDAPSGRSDWVVGLSIVALTAYIGSVACQLAVSWSARFRSGVDPGVLLDDSWEPHTEQTGLPHLAGYMARAVTCNRDVLDSKTAWLDRQILCSGLSVALWAAALLVAQQGGPAHAEPASTSAAAVATTATATAGTAP